jgi:hypothetical protein
MVHSSNGFFMNWTGTQKGEGFEYHLLALAVTAFLFTPTKGERPVRSTNEVDKGRFRRLLFEGAGRRDLGTTSRECRRFEVADDGELLNVYRIGREALVNAFCHSGAKRINLELEYSDSELYVRIRDNGRGIDPQMLAKGRDGHWGLAGMRERATKIGGVLKILSSPAAGTEVQLSIPTTSIEGIEGFKRKPKMSCRIDRVVMVQGQRRRGGRWRRTNPAYLAAWNTFR